MAWEGQQSASDTFVKQGEVQREVNRFVQADFVQANFTQGDIAEGDIWKISVITSDTFVKQGEV